VRENVVGKFATVRVRGPKMEGATLEAPLLFERFSFGWKAVEIANVPCRIRGRGSTASQAEHVVRGMPEMHSDGSCEDADIDFGSRADVDALRLLERGLLIPSVRVAGRFARVE
jgi:hypothetical protein